MDEAGLRKLLGSGERKVEQTTRTYGETHPLTHEAREELKVIQAEGRQRAQAKPDDPTAAAGREATDTFSPGPAVQASVTQSWVSALAVFEWPLGTIANLGILDEMTLATPAASSDSSGE